MSSQVVSLQPEPRLGREPPHDFFIEQAVLGALLIRNDAYLDVCERLRPEHFADPFHGRIYEAIAGLIERNATADPRIVAALFVGDPSLAKRPNYLAELALAAISTRDLADYARTLLDLFTRRELIVLGQDLIDGAHAVGSGQSAADIAMSADERLFAATRGRSASTIHTMREAAYQAIVRLDAYHKSDDKLGVETGFTEIDNIIGAMMPGEFWILGGRPSMGKSALADAIAENAVADGHGVGFWSYDMTIDQLAQRALARRSGVSTRAMRRKGGLSPADFEKLLKAHRELSESIFIDRPDGQTVQTIRNQVRRLKITKNIRLVVIDYLQLLDDPQTRRGGDNRTQELSSITKALKTMSVDLEVVTLALSQLSRNVEARDDKRPMLSDLRESGSIEQDADGVMFIYRGEYYLERKSMKQHENETPQKFSDRLTRHENELAASRGRAEVLIPKSRQTDVGTAHLLFDKTAGTFSNEKSASSQGSLDYPDEPL